MNTIFIYSGQGVASHCIEHTIHLLRQKYGHLYTLVRATAEQLAEEKTPPKLYVLPGGSAITIGQDLDPAMPKIRKFIAQGSGLLAMCAGAMTASTQWKYILPHPKYQGRPDHENNHILSDFVCRSKVLGLGSRAIGPVFFNQNCPLAEHLTYSPHVARLTSIHLPDIHKSFRCFWDRGPAFSNTLGEMRIASYHPSKDISPIVDYCFVTTSPFPAAISFRYHSGPVSFLGVHPELAEWCLKEGYSLSSDDLKLNHYLFERSCQLAGLSS